MTEVALHIGSSSSRRHVEEFLEANEDGLDFPWLAQVGDGIGEGITVLEAKQWRQLAGIQFFHADVDIVGEHEFKEDLLLDVEMAVSSGVKT